ncbi:hypothetical protein P3S67_028155 [Capsicum chacoense]
MKPHTLISCLLISLFIHDLVMVNQSSSILCVEARPLSRFSYSKMFNSHDKVVIEGVKYLDRNKGGRRVPTPSPPKPNLKIRWKPILPHPSPPPPPPPGSSTSYQP